MDILSFFAVSISISFLILIVLYVLKCRELEKIRKVKAEEIIEKIEIRYGVSKIELIKEPEDQKKVVH